MEKKFVPLLFAGDINVCSVARAFHEEYGIISHVWGKFPTGPCMDSRIMDYHANEKADEQETFMKLVREFAAEHKDETVLLIGCGDSYVELASANKDYMPENVIAPYINIDLMHDLIHKEKFYDLCEKFEIDYPDTFVYKKEMEQDFKLPFKGPFIIKPSNGIEYWQHPYPGQKKVYKVDTMDDVKSVLSDIYGAGYEDSVIIQNFIPGDDTFMRVLTTYSDQNGDVKMMCLGHVLLEEHTPHGIGNHAVIITEENEELKEKFKALLERLAYVGFANFDIKYDLRDKTFKVFEINTRQGRSNYYVTGSGANVAKCFVEDRIKEGPMEYMDASKKNLWMVVPKKVAFRYVDHLEYREEMTSLIREGKVVNPLIYGPDRSFIRRLRIWRNMHRHYRNFKIYMP
ncbi:MAG: ATP-grasp domain-containing protein [Firmicutes bacterium]|nr:ATP-grasp domain-containing protein [Bacillota bacterium]